MTPDHPLTSAHLASLLGEQIHDVPQKFIETLERRLQQYATEHPASTRLTHLTLVPSLPAPDTDPSAELERLGKVAVPIRVMQALDAALEILHAEHIARCDGDTASLLGEHLVDGLLVAGRELIKASAGRQLDAR
ncbi:hypothetical protein ABRP17_008660 [Stenotrophomonas sp. WHRI 8082]|uniref:hypothetical protein n=1 Tax=Stenotrophomonas sp. WHRI 8082 TaxID=3162571 RepID=UPI0032F08036